MSIFEDFRKKAAADDWITPKERKDAPKVGDTIEVGEWNGKSLQWIILNIYPKEGNALLLSKYALMKKTYHEKWTAVTWEECSLRQYLQTQFVEDVKFNAEEMKRIVPVRNINPENADYQTPGGNPTWDKVFALSIDEYKRYLNRKGMIQEIVSCENLKGERVWWWLRSPGHGDRDAARVSSDGSLLQHGLTVIYGLGWVRPAFYYNLRS